MLLLFDKNICMRFKLYLSFLLIDTHKTKKKQNKNKAKKEHLEQIKKVIVSEKS